MHYFDYSFLENGSIPANILNITAAIYALNEGNNIRIENNSSIFSSLENIARIQSVKNSNAIEGIITSDERIREIVARSSAPLNHDEEEIAGYRDALNMIHTSYNDMQLNEKTVLKIHGTLLSLTSDSLAGKYKTDDNQIIEIDPNGHRRIRFSPVSALETNEAMEQLILAYTEAHNNSKINQLLLIPCFVLDFLCVHPFSDGNGRMSRLLSLLLLYKNGFNIGKYLSFEEQINNNKWDYYESLKYSSEGWHENASDYFPFVYNFLITLYRCYKELDSRFSIVNLKSATKGSRIEAIVLNAITPISKSDICSVLPDISPTTVEAVLGKMVKKGQIKKIGAARSTKYMANIGLNKKQ